VLVPTQPGVLRPKPVEVLFVLEDGSTLLADATVPVPWDVWVQNRNTAIDRVEFEFRGESREVLAVTRLKAQALAEVSQRYSDSYQAYVSNTMKLSPNARVKNAKACFEYVASTGSRHNPSTIKVIDVVLMLVAKHHGAPVYCSNMHDLSRITAATRSSNVQVTCSVTTPEVEPSRSTIVVGRDAYECWSNSASGSSTRVKAYVVIPDWEVDGFELNESWEDIDDPSGQAIGACRLYQVRAGHDATDPTESVLQGWTGDVAWKMAGTKTWVSGRLPQRLWGNVRVVNHEDWVDDDPWGDQQVVRRVVVAGKLPGGAPPVKARDTRRPGRSGAAAAAGQNPRGRECCGSRVRRTAPADSTGSSAGTSAASTTTSLRAQRRNARRERRDDPELMVEAGVDLAAVQAALALRVGEELAASHEASVEEAITTLQAAAARRLERCVHLDSAVPSVITRPDGRAYCSRHNLPLFTAVACDEASERSSLAAEGLTGLREVHEDERYHRQAYVAIINHMRAHLTRITNPSESTFMTVLSTTMQRFSEHASKITDELLRWVVGQVELHRAGCAQLEVDATVVGGVRSGRLAGSVGDPNLVRTIVEHCRFINNTYENHRLELIEFRKRVVVLLLKLCLAWRRHRVGVALVGTVATHLVGSYATYQLSKYLPSFARRFVASCAIAYGSAVAVSASFVVATLACGKLRTSYGSPARDCKPSLMGPHHAAMFEKLGTFVDELDCRRNESICLKQPAQPDPTKPDCPVDPQNQITKWPRLDGCDREGQFGGELFAAAFCWAQVARSCMCNCCNALVRRHAVRRPPCERPLVSVWSPFDDDLAARVAFEYHETLQDVEASWLDWAPNALGGAAERTKWSQAVVAKFRAGFQSQPPDPSVTDGFPKREIGKAVYYHETDGALSRARLIHPYRFDAAKELMGREFAAWQRALFKVLSVAEPYEYAPGIFILVGCGVGKGAIARWAEHRAAWYLESDASTWDAFVNNGMIDYKHRHLDNVDRRMGDFARQYARTRVQIRGKNGTVLAYTLAATVRSGYNDTTSGNSLINAIATAQAMRAARLEGRILVAGDDMLTAVTSSPHGGWTPNLIVDAAKAVSGALTRFGIVPKWGAFMDVGDTTFCSSGFYRFGGRLTFLPLLGRQLAKLWWTTKDISPKHRAAYSTAVSKCMSTVVGTVPLYREWVQLGYVEGSKPLAGGLAELERDLAYKPGVGVESDHFFTDHEAFEGLAEKYGVTLDELMSLAEFIMMIPKNTPCAVGHPVGRHIVEFDHTDPCSRPTRVVASGGRL